MNPRLELGRRPEGMRRVLYKMYELSPTRPNDSMNSWYRLAQFLIIEQNELGMG